MKEIFVIATVNRYNIKMYFAGTVSGSVWTEWILGAKQFGSYGEAAGEILGIDTANEWFSIEKYFVKQ